jgi:hypothetical protein
LLLLLLLLLFVVVVVVVVVVVGIFWCVEQIMNINDHTGVFVTSTELRSDDTVNAILGDSSKVARWVGNLCVVCCVRVVRCVCVVCCVLRVLRVVCV